MPPQIPTMTLIYHPLSPYSRKVYMLAHELDLTSQITLQKVVVCPILNYPGWSDNNADLVSAGNPLAKIPTLVIHDPEAGDVPIFDSRAICETLRDMAVSNSSSTSATRNQGWLEIARERTLASIADGILDAQILITYETTLRAEKNILMPEWIQGQTAKIQRSLDALERDFAGTKFLSQTGGMGEVAVAVAIDCTESRVKNGDWKVGRPELAKWWEGWRERESFEMTKPSLDWKTGRKADLGPLPADPKLLGSRM
ncbi:Aquaporin-like protein [Venturia nashicola]|uniref:Aquaporin-like protein n=1 Tax=Venturia nashicola TaxID=86259 RepID=A0A4Z1P4H4_9PEZI|nr:Aquaporin-like protein [Venturia nashicola]